MGLPLELELELELEVELELEEVPVAVGAAWPPPQLAAARAAPATNAPACARRHPRCSLGCERRLIVRAPPRWTGRPMVARGLLPEQRRRFRADRASCLVVGQLAAAGGR